MKLIDISGCNELYNFRLALQSVYDRSVYYAHMKDDYPHLLKIKEGFVSLDKSEWGQVKQAYDEWIIHDIEKYLERITPDP